MPLIRTTRLFATDTCLGHLSGPGVPAQGPVDNQAAAGDVSDSPRIDQNVRDGGAQ